MSVATPVGGSFWTRSTRLLAVLAATGFAIIAWRFLVGLGPTTALSDGYPFGLWIAFDVVTGTAIACGGYAVALLVYVLNKGRYHSLVRPALLTSALGYSLAGFAIAVDVGRPWGIWKVPLFGHRWNFNSALLEVALCVMAYIVVLWLELSPAFLEKWEGSRNATLARFSRRTRPVIEKALFALIALGLLLPTMHQSSLGTLMLLAGPKLHPLWSSAAVPALFLVGCVAMGYGMVVVESVLGARYFGRRPETDMLAALSTAAVWAAGIWLAIRLADVAVRGVFGLAFQPTEYAFWFWLEIALAVWALLLLTTRPRNLRNLFHASLLLIFGGGLYRFDTYLIAYNPGDHWSYAPSIPELLVTLGIVALEVLAYVWIVRRYPILGGREPMPREAARA